MDAGVSGSITVPPAAKLQSVHLILPVSWERSNFDASAPLLDIGACGRFPWATLFQALCIYCLKRGAEAGESGCKCSRWNTHSGALRAVLETPVGTERAFVPGTSWGVERRLCPGTASEAETRLCLKPLGEKAIWAHRCGNHLFLVLSAVRLTSAVHSAGVFQALCGMPLLTKHKLCSSPAQNCLISGALLHKLGKQAARRVVEMIRHFEENAACLICRDTCLQPQPETACQNVCAGDAYRIPPVCLEVECEVAV